MPAATSSAPIPNVDADVRPVAGSVGKDAGRIGVVVVAGVLSGVVVATVDVDVVVGTTAVGRENVHAWTRAF